MARWKGSLQIAPTPRLAWLSSLAGPSALAGFVSPAGTRLAGAGLLRLAAFAGADAWLAGDPGLASVTRVAPPRGVQGRPFPVRLLVVWSGPRPARLRIRD